MTGNQTGCPPDHRPVTGRPCGVCRRDQTLAAVIAAEPSLPSGTVTVAFHATITTSRAVGVLADALAADPSVLHTGAPPVVGRLVVELVTRGSTTFTMPSCHICARTGRPLTVTDQGGMCRRCVHRRGATACTHCHQIKPVAAHNEDGQPMCERCRRHRRGHRRCGLCHTTAAIARRARGGDPDVCVNCYRLPEAVCSRCHQRRPCNFVDSDAPICKGCAPRPTAVCARCDAERPVTARWAEGPVCEPCYRAALHRRGRCAGCDQQRRLVDPAGPDANRCADCAEVDLPGNHVCTDCGIEDRLFERGRCARCSLQRRTAALLADDQGHIPAVLEPVAAAIGAARQPYSTLNWLRNGVGAAILAELASSRMEATHHALDTHPNTRGADYLRRLLTAHGALPDRDDELARTDAWTAELLATIERDDDRRLVATYATWRVLRRLRARADRAQGPHTATRHARNQLTAAIALLDWLAARGLTLTQARQGDIDTWLTTGPAAHHIRDFIGWATQHGRCPPLTIPPATSATGTAMNPDERLDLLARLLHDDTLELTDRVAGSLLLAYAQPLSRITAITLDRIGRDGSGHVATIRFGNDGIRLPEPLASLTGTLIDTPRAYVGLRAPEPSPWLFPGGQPGRPLTPSRLGTRLRKLGIDARAARRAALIHLAAHLPAAVLADLLHLTPGTAVRWVNNAGGDWSRYAAALATETTNSPTQ